MYVMPLAKSFVEYKSRITLPTERGKSGILQLVANVAREMAEELLPDYVLESGEALNIEAVRKQNGVGIEFYAVKNEDNERQLFRLYVEFRPGDRIHALDVREAVKGFIFSHF